MKKLAIVFAVGATALLGGSASNAAANTAVKAKAATDVTQPSTDISSRGRHWRHHGHYRMHRHWRHAYYRPYARSYGSYAYAPEPYYYGGGPVLSFGFGGGGWRGGGWGHHHRGW
jgi:hypothetical protein